jgi:hypothetical protein
MTEGIPETTAGNNLSRQRISLARRHPRPQVRNGPALRGLHQLVNGSLPLVRSATDHDGSCQVRAVAIDLGSEVQE